MTAVPNSLAIDMYRRMQRIRQFEATASELLARGEIAGGLHTTTGQEAAIVGACLALTREDYMVGTHRSHGHPIGKGARLDRLMAELLARATGVNCGKGGSMHLSDFSVGSLGETSIVGSGFPIATGAALGSKMQKNGRVALCFFGDGASSEGTFHESLNIASIWKLPVIYFCENNGYAISTPAHETISVQDIAVRAAGYGMPGHVVDGQDVLAVYAVTHDAVERARAGQGPTLIEAKTYRFQEHAAGLKIGEYRREEEIQRWQARDPIQLFRRELVEKHVLSAEHLDAIDREVAAEINQAVEFGLNSPHPQPHDAYDHVFVDPLLPLEEVR
ncbi:MAG: thiamine pyrophosphate-dependent dehydrogenase E1 component subunit alpha [Steroidobacteraceae bacterium]